MEGLPNVPGPKLQPFELKGELLDLRLVAEIGRGLHSYVWNVQINGKNYVLRIFNRQGSHIPRPYSIQDLPPYCYPFPCEARALARLKESGREHLAIRCYGYLLLEGEHRELLRGYYKEFYEESDGQPDHPIYGIVKELISIPKYKSQAEFLGRSINPAIASKAIKGLKTIHRLGIDIRDFRRDNIVFGQFIDLSCAWTAPHPFLDDARGRGQESEHYSTAMSDAEILDEFIEEWNAENPRHQVWARALPNLCYKDKLRASTRRQEKYTWDYQPEDFIYQVADKIFKRVIASVDCMPAPMNKISGQIKMNGPAHTLHQNARKSASNRLWTSKGKTVQQKLRHCLKLT